jgi:endonuclease/exonuclease/phosphatase (EEP) superfamily protein YafD
VGVVVVALAAAAVALSGAAAGTARPSADPQVAALQKQVRQTNKTVAKLEARIAKLEKSNKTFNLVAVATIAGIACEAAVTADALQATWGVTDQIAQAAQAKTYFGPQTPVNDQSSCSDLDIKRQLPGAAPSVASFTALADLFYGP